MASEADGLPLKLSVQATLDRSPEVGLRQLHAQADMYRLAMESISVILDPLQKLRHPWAKPRPVNHVHY